MTLLATRVASHLGGTTFGGFGAVTITAGSCGGATTVLVGAFTASSLLSPASSFSLAAASVFSVGTAAADFSEATTAAGVERSMDDMASVGPVFRVSRKLVVPLSYSFHDAIAANTVTRCKVPRVRLVLSRQSVE